MEVHLEDVFLELGLIDQAVMNGVEGKFKAVGYTELIEDIVKMVLHGLFADEKFFADFLVPVTLRNQLDDFLFAVTQQGFLAARSPSEDFEKAFMTSAVM